MRWTDEQIGLLRRMHAEGNPASWIAASLGVSRNAVLGKLFRLGLAEKTSVLIKRARRERRKVAGNRAAAAQTKPAVVKRSTIPQPRFSAPDGSDIPLDQRKQLLELRDEHCRYAFGDPGTASFFFCAHPSASLSAGRPYCEVHVRLAYCDDARMVLQQCAV